MAYKKKVTKKTSGGSGGASNLLTGGLVGYFMQGFGTNLLGAQGGQTVTKKVIKKTN